MRERIPAWLWREVAVPFLVTRAALLATGLAAMALLPPNPLNGDLATSPLVNVWSRFDAFWHVTIALFGYGYVSGGQSNLAFPPLFAALMKAGGLALGQDDVQVYLAIGILVSNLALLAACAALYDVARAAHGDTVARRAVWYLLVFPTTLFLSAAYSDSLFLAFATGAFAAARRERWWLAGVLAAGATLARVQGLLVVLPLALHYALWHRARVRPDVAGLALGPLAFAAWLAYQAVRFGDPLAFVAAERAWERHFTPPWDLITSEPAFRTGLDALMAVAFLLLVLASWRLVRPSLALYATLFYLVPLASGSLQSEARYVLYLFPCFIVLAGVTPNALVERVAVAASFSAALACMVLFALRYWVA